MPTQINIWASDELTEGLTRLCPDGIALSAFARKVLENFAQSGELPALQPRSTRGTVVVPVDLSPILVAIEALGARQDEAQREMLRAVHEHGSWARGRLKTDAVLDQKARDEGEQLVRAWERSVGR